MEPGQNYKLIRIFLGESDKLNNVPLYEALIKAAKKEGMNGATVLRGILSFGAGSRIHTEKILELSYDRPVVIEIVDTEDKIGNFLQAINPMIEKAACGAMITMEKAEVILYRQQKKDK
jgi:PII-like signaling protein